MTSCEIEYTDDDRALWCIKHSGVPSHVGPDGDNTVCGYYAKEYGCNCCEENHEKSDIPRIPIVSYSDGDRRVLDAVAGEVVVDLHHTHVVLNLDKDSELWRHFEDKMSVVIKKTGKEN